MAERLEGGADDLLSRRSIRFRELGLSGRTFTEEELLDLLAAEPTLLRRPIFVSDERVVVGAAEPTLRSLLGEDAAVAGGAAASDLAGNGRTKPGR